MREIPRIYVAVVGVPRYFDTVLPELLHALKKSGSSHISGFFWAYSNVEIPSTNSLVHITPKTTEDWLKVTSLSFDSVVTAKPLGRIPIDTTYEQHPQIAELGLKLNPSASFSWLAAIEQGALALKHAEGSGQADYWMIVRPDLKISSRATRKLFANLSQDELWNHRSIAVAARSSRHRVLVTERGVSNLLVDHFFIGKPEAIGEFVGLTQMLQRIAAGVDVRQPLFNEFLLGQYLVDKNLFEYPVRLPYWVWRGSLFSTIFSAAGRRGLSLLGEGARSLFWNLRGLISPGFHDRGV